MESIHPGHNTYLISGDLAEGVLLSYRASEEILSVAPRGNPDFWHGAYTQITIEESRNIRALRAGKPFGLRRVMIVEALSMTTEAQQALLKFLEELSSDMFFFLVLPTVEQTLPTLRSRMVRVQVSRADDDVAGTEFLSAPWSVRSKTIEKIAKEKDTKKAYLLLNALECVLSPEAEKYHSALKTLIIGKKRVLSGIVPLKMNLESVALELPRIMKEK